MSKNKNPLTHAESVYYLDNDVSDIEILSEDDDNYMESDKYEKESKC